jgi:diadenosine tetraphosphate (Ap4A) HIT family hydrolase
MSQSSEATKECGCPFCEMPAQRVIMENAHAYAIRDVFPGTEARSLVNPKRRVADYFGVTSDALFACDELIRILRRAVMLENSAVVGPQYRCGAKRRPWTLLL